MDSPRGGSAADEKASCRKPAGAWVQSADAGCGTSLEGNSGPS